MKNFWKYILLVLGSAGSLIASLAAANPFQGPYVCVPVVSPDQNPLEFDIREGGGACKEGETFMAVSPQKDGSILLYPSNPPLEPEAQKEWDAYKKYLGGESDVKEENKKMPKEYKP